MPTKTTKPTTAKTGRKTTAPTKGNTTFIVGDRPQQRPELDIEHFRTLILQEMTRLEEEREFIRNRNLDMDGNLPEDAEGEEDTADLASSLMDKEMDLSVEEEIEETLLAIEHALQKIEDGTYGICDVSGKEIPATRLELIPWASLTVECQALAEGE